jgi:DNA (cytosine-5)-methyltransferase 1
MTPRSDFNVDQMEMRLAPDEIIVDSFAGGGGASLGIQWALGRGPHIAINHDKEAIALHAANHPDSEHYPEDVWHVDPVEACAGRKVGLMWLSPDCKHFSKAKGGKPVSKKIRGLAWTAVRWATAVRPRVIVLENVEEFQTWGPVDRATNRPCPERKGHTFKRFVARLRRLGYQVEWRELRACDYGAPTIRKRLFLIARCDGRSITWPQPTHGKGRAQPWRTAAECIEWAIPCPSIFERKKPLADNTMRRIARGIKRYVIDSPMPFIVHFKSDAPASVAAPFPTQTSRDCFGIVSPLIAGVGGRAGQSPERRVDQPYQTITSKADAAIVAPFLKPRFGEDPDPSRRGGLGQAPRVRALDIPAPTIVPTGNGGDLVAAFLAKHYGGHETPGASLADPASTITTQDHHHLVTAHVAKHYGDRVGSSLEEPLHTVTAESVHHALVASSLLNLHGTSDSHMSGRSLDDPMATIAAGGMHAAEVRAFLCAYYGNEKDGGSLHDPIRTVTSKDRFGLVTVAGVEYQIADIGMRMLAPRELYRAQGFPDSYAIDIEYNGKPMTKTAQVRMCGNSVCPPLAAAIISANLLGETFAPVVRERVA